LKARITIVLFNLSVGKFLDKGESFTPDADFAADDDFGKAQNYSPDVTVPLFTFDKNEAAQAGTTSAFDSISEGGDRKTSAGASFMPPENYSQPETTFTPTPAPVKQKSSSKAIAVVGILAVLLFLAIGGAGVGWYMLRDNGGTTEKITPTPTAEASVSVEPTAAPTLEVVTETNTSTNSEVEISNTKSVTTNSAINRPKIEVVIPKPRPTQVVQQPTPGQPPPTRPPPTPRPSVPTPVKTPKPRPTIVIVQ